MADFILKERTRKGLSQRGLSDLCGVRAATICQIEKGQLKGGYETIHSILQGLGFDLDIKKLSGLSKS